MLKDFGESIQSGKLEFMFLSVISSKLKVIIIGGGKAGLIKAKSFSKKGCPITVISPSFVKDFDKLIDVKNVELIKDTYKEHYILDKHLVVIASDHEDINMVIKKDCERLSKLFIYCPYYKNGMAIAPAQCETENIEYALHTREGSPKTSKMLLDVIGKTLKEYSSFVEYSCNLRKLLKGFDKKDEIMSFISNEDFKFFYDKGIHEYILEMFYGGNYFEFKDSHKEKQTCSDTDRTCN
jgi:precorrin-2 dehydrogenase / sirohydrochlorin ferrochelatase